MNPGIGTPQIRLLESLCAASAISGQESEVRKLVQSALEGHADELRTDALGNLLVSKKGSSRGGRLKVLLAAHMDEVGLMVTGDDKDGIFRFDVVGGLRGSQLVGKTVIVGKDHVPGVIGFKPIHLTTSSERGTAVSVDSLRIDIGNAPNGKVKVGDRVTFTPNFRVLGRGASRSIASKALDDRIGVASLIELVRHAPPGIDLCAAFTTQEEIGVRGAQVAAHHFEPDIAIALDCSPANDLPHWDGDENTQYNTRLGSGPAIYIADRGTLSDPRLVRHFASVAETEGIPYQYRQAGGGGTDASAMHRVHGGVPSMSISVPGRYLHTASGLVSFSDWQNTFRLVHAALSQMKPALLKQPRA